MIIELFGLQGAGKSTVYHLFDEEQETSPIKTLSFLSEQYYKRFPIYKICKFFSKKSALRMLRLFSPIFNIVKLKHFFINKKNIKQFKARILRSSLFENKKETRVFFRRIRYRIILTSIINTKFSKSIILLDEGYLQLLLMFAVDMKDLDNFEFDLNGIIFVNVSSMLSVQRQIERDGSDAHSHLSTEEFLGVMKKREERVNEIINYYKKVKIYSIDNESKILNEALVSLINGFFNDLKTV
ncbi:MAG: hypothetical protein WCZ24_03590 [Bacilli bacterium]